MVASASDWSCRVGNLLQPIRNTIQILVVNVIRMEFLRSFLRLHFAVKPEVASQNVGCFLRHDTQVLFMRGFRFRSKACSWLPPKAEDVSIGDRPRSISTALNQNLCYPEYSLDYRKLS